MRKIHLIATLLTFLSFNSNCQQAFEHQKTSEANEYMFKASVDDLARAFDSPERDAWQKPDKVIEFLGDIRGKTIVDLGSGSGYFSLRLAVAGAKVLAADVNDEFIQIIEEKKQEYNIADHDLKTVKIEERSLNLAPATADILFMVNVYHHISDRERYFKNANAVLKRDGKIVIVDFYKKSIPVGPPKNHKISKEEVVRELHNAGYMQIEMDTTLLEYQYIITANAFEDR